MKTFVADIIPKIQRYSQKLDNIALLTNQHWVVLDELGQSKIIYIFRNTNELIISTNGKVEKAKWEYLGHNSILIDLNEQSYLFKHGFFDENILALKIDSKDEYGILINENRYNGELNNISSVLNFLSQKYLITTPNKQLAQSEITISDFQYQKNGYTFKMGSFKEFIVRLSNGQIFNVYQKVSSGKYFMYTNNEIVLFPNKETCLKYVEGLIR